VILEAKDIVPWQIMVFELYDIGYIITGNLEV
jgi:hypothetical protein